jgi:hypothetical protein
MEGSFNTDSQNIDMVKNFFLSLNDGVVMNQLLHFEFLVIAN